MTFRKSLLFVAAGLIAFASGMLPGCSGSEQSMLLPRPEGSAELVLIQLNDVYEIAPIRNGRAGGLARVASLKKRVRSEHPNVRLVLAGDFLSPSAIGTSKIDGKLIAGAQMVDAANAAGLDLVTFGNHEFDIKQEELQKRIDESRFEWISSNVREVTGSGTAPFARRSAGTPSPFPEYAIIEVPGPKGRSARVGLLAVTLDKNRAPYVAYEDPYAAASRIYARLKDQTDCVVALTHLSIDEDRELARRVPGLTLIMGGHEHANMVVRVGQTLITKADANARTAWVHQLRVGPAGTPAELFSELLPIDDGIAEDSLTAAVVTRWTAAAYAGFEQLGLHPDSLVATFTYPLDGRESSIRSRQTNLGTLLCRAMMAGAKGVDLALMSSGSVRIDDEVVGPVTEYDVIRILPFGGKVLEATVAGGLLRRVLDIGRANAGTGGFLQVAGAERDERGAEWRVHGIPLDTARSYRVVFNDYLLSGLENNLGFLRAGAPGISGVREPEGRHPNDIRRAVVSYMKRGGR